ncbi:hypothetical protein JOC55_005475 [Paenibacillus sacheonensis]|nr:hypothetical protein [Paenibacillus sacheonensis]
MTIVRSFAIQCRTPTHDGWTEKNERRKKKEEREERKKEKKRRKRRKRSHKFAMRLPETAAFLHQNVLFFSILLRSSS